MQTTAPTTTGELDSSSEVLAFARLCRREADRAEASLLAAAVTWAEQHPPESIHDAATWMSPAGDTGLLLAGPGAPLVAEFCIAEFALAIGLSTDSGRVLIAQAVELKHRLPKLWARVMGGDLPGWRARRVAEQTICLSVEAVAFIDTQVAAFAHKIGPAALERLVEEATVRFMPEKATEDAERAADGRHLRVHHDQVSFNGTTRIEGELDLADALDLDTALAQGAEQLKACGSTESLDVRRAIAAGEIARNQLALDLELTTDTGTGTRSKKAAKSRQVVLYVHLSEAAIGGIGQGTSQDTGNGIDLARVENTRTGVTADQIKTWCGNPDTHVTVKPVIDLAEHIGKGGTTCSCNTAPVCRRHHRLKTHTPWIYSVLEPGTFLWTSPHGYQYLRDHTGTLDVSADRRPRNLHSPEA